MGIACEKFNNVATQIKKEPFGSLGIAPLGEDPRGGNPNDCPCGEVTHLEDFSPSGVGGGCAQRDGGGGGCLGGHLVFNFHGVVLSGF